MEINSEMLMMVSVSMSASRRAAKIVMVSRGPDAMGETHFRARKGMCRELLRNIVIEIYGRIDNLLEVRCKGSSRIVSEPVINLMSVMFIR